MRRLKIRKAQSAMEYLMTYGWAILIIAVVLGALFSLGVFGGQSFLGTQCIPTSGYYCGSLSYAHSSGNIGVTIGQSTGTSWANTIVILAPQGSNIGTAGPIVVAADTNTINGGLTSGSQAGLTYFAVGSSPVVGATLAGSVWVCYITGVATTTTLTYAPATGICTAGSGTPYYAQLGTFTAKAT